MHRILSIGILLVLALIAPAAEPEYSRDVARWQEVSVPPETDQDAREVWSRAANYSDYEWRVFSERGQTFAQLTTAKDRSPKDRPTFTAKAGRFSKATAFAAVDDGWLVGFNHGEFGAALYWFSRDGKRSYEVSGHHVVEFFSLPDGLHAIEGLAHLSMSEGSIIRISRSRLEARWQASTVTKLPFAPRAISLRKDGTMLITLSDSLVAIGADRKIQTLLSDPPWQGLYPNSSVLSPDEQKLYIGMRQFVGEFDIPSMKLRFLVPSDVFINKLSKDDESRGRGSSDQ